MSKGTVDSSSKMLDILRDFNSSVIYFLIFEVENFDILVKQFFKTWFSIQEILFLMIRIFIPQIATLPSNNSTSEWDNIKYLIHHFDSSWSNEAAGKNKAMRQQAKMGQWGSGKNEAMRQ